MKSVLSFLLCVVLVHGLTPAAHAKRGGPDGSTQSVNFLSVMGTYAGVLIPVRESGTNTGTTADFNSLGIFSMTSPESGAATGSFQFFANGEVFAGTITGIIDPDGRTINGVLDAATTLEDGFGGTFDGQALGQLFATILKNDFTGLQGTSTSARLAGFAHLEIFLGSGLSAGSFDFIVDGFKQSDTVTSTPTLPTGTGTTGTGTGTGGTIPVTQVVPQ